MSMATIAGLASKLTPKHVATWIGYRIFQAGKIADWLAHRRRERELRDIDSGFRFLIEALPLKKRCRALDVGAGGFVGETTTRHLLEALKARIDAVEIDASLCEQLRKRFGRKITVSCADIESFAASAKQKYDLIVHDVTPRDLLLSMLPRYARLLKADGWLVCYFASDEIIGDPAFAPLPTTDPRLAQLRSIVGPGFHVRGLIDKWRLRSDRRGSSFLVMQPEAEANA